MKKLFLSTALFLLFLAPILVNAQIVLVPCDGPDCTIDHFFQLLDNIFNFIVYWVATPLAILMLTIGGIMIMISGGVGQVAGGSATMFSQGKKVIYVSIIGLALVFCSWLIVNFILCTALGYCSWNVL